MEATKLRDAELIAQYKRESVERRAARKLTGTSKLANKPTEQDEQSTVKKGNKVLISYQGGRVTVDTQNATPLPATADKSKIFGRSSISIPELQLHRGK